MSHYDSSNINDERRILLNILNKMYNDNHIQINSLYQSNNQIRSMLYSLYDNNNRNDNPNHNNHNNRNTNTLRNYSRQNPNISSRQNTNISRNITSQSNSTNSLGRIHLNDIPYIIDSYQEYYIPNNNPNLVERGSRRNVRNVRVATNNPNSQLNNFFDPVEVFPTTSQIEIATRCVRYCDIVSPRNVQCPISLENFNDNDTVTVIRYCGHIFNTEQLNTWFRSNCRCPICRYDVRSYNSNTSPQTSSVEETNEESNQETNSNNVSNNFSQQVNEERSNTFDTILNILTSSLSQDQLLGMQDSSANLIYDSSDPNAIRNLINVLNRYTYN
uniref:RING-type domain-containing protein n=1 Tax=viral metagenome TaxID=1070528 RepID=A0A6C0ID15_9ZZZZ